MVTVADVKSGTPAGAEKTGRGELRSVDKNDLRIRRAILTALFQRWENVREELEIIFGPPAIL